MRDVGADLVGQPLGILNMGRVDGERVRLLPFREIFMLQATPRPCRAATFQ